MVAKFKYKGIILYLGLKRICACVVLKKKEKKKKYYKEAKEKRQKREEKDSRVLIVCE